MLGVGCQHVLLLLISSHELDNDVDTLTMQKLDAKKQDFKKSLNKLSPNTQRAVGKERLVSLLSFTKEKTKSKKWKQNPDRDT